MTEPEHVLSEDKIFVQSFAIKSLVVNSAFLAPKYYEADSKWTFRAIPLQDGRHSQLNLGNLDTDDECDVVVAEPPFQHA